MELEYIPDFLDFLARNAMVGGTAVRQLENLDYEMLHEEFLNSDYEGTFSNYLADRLASLSEVIRVLDGRISRLERDLIRQQTEIERLRNPARPFGVPTPRWTYTDNTTTPQVIITEVKNTRWTDKIRNMLLGE